METKVKGINLLPKEYVVAQKINFYEKVIGIVAAVEVVCFIGLVALPPKREVARTQQVLEEKQAQLNSPRYAGVNKTMNELEQAKTEIQNWIDEYNNIKLKNYISGQLLDELAARIPDGVNVTTMKIDDSQTVEDDSIVKTIEITGRADIATQIVSYVSVMETLFPSQNITHSFEYDESTGKYTFTIKITISTPVNPPEEEAAAEGDAASENSEETGEQTASADEGGEN